MSREITLRLRPKQEQAYFYMAQGKNIFITGAGGVGKSALIKTFMKTYQYSKKIALTSTTGTSALLLNGTTIHSYLGIGYGNGSVESLVKKICSWKWLYNRWSDVECLIIDEISMLDPDLFDKLEEIARCIRHNDKPFGGIQLILSGDFCQLPCVGTNKFCFEAKSWNKCIIHTVYLNEIIRQSDRIFQEVLNKVRIGIIDNQVKNILNKRIGIKLENDYGIKPTKLYSTNFKVDNVNNEELDILAEDGRQFYEYLMDIVVQSQVNNKHEVKQKFYKNCNVPEVLQLCIGAQVMLLKNLDVTNGLANGSRGVVINFIGDIPIVRFLNGVERIIDYDTWEVTENDKKILCAHQIPLKVAYAISIHKCCAKNTLIYTKNGIQRISKISDDLVGNHREYTTVQIDYSVIGKKGYKKATQIYKGGIENTIILTTSLGFIIEGSNKHPILTFDGINKRWKKLPEIQNGEYLVLKKNTQSFGKIISTEKFFKDENYKFPYFIDEQIGYLIGLLVGNGCYSNRRNYSIEFTVLKEKTKILVKFLNIFNNVFDQKCKIYNYSDNSKLIINSKMIREFLLWCGLDYVTSEEKTIPWVILENNKETHIAYLKGLYDTNGSINKDCIEYTIFSKQLAIEIQCVLLNMGIISSIRLLENESQSYRIDITEYNAYIFAKIIGFDDNEKQDILILNTKYNNIPNIFFDKVVSIDKGKNQLYDLYIPEDHTFVGNGIINHNSQGCSLDYAEIDLSDIFEYGMTYVALSRVKNLEGLNIIDIDYDNICAHPVALEYYNSLKENEF